MNCPFGHELTLRVMNCSKLHELPAALKEGQFNSWSAEREKS
jgi:hypothetical protein